MTAPLPGFAAWRHVGARDGFEVVFLRDGRRVEGHASAVEDGVPWAVRYVIELDGAWATRRAHVVAETEHGRAETRLEADGVGGWAVDGAAAPELDGCLDVDLEASAFTNALPVHRLALEHGATADAPAVYVRAPSLAVERLEQEYERLDAHRYAYAAPRFGYLGELVYDDAGLVVDYPGLATRVA
jgi:hypothetical protein